MWKKIAWLSSQGFTAFLWEKYPKSNSFSRAIDFDISGRGLSPHRSWEVCTEINDPILPQSPCHEAVSVVCISISMPNPIWGSHELRFPINDTKEGVATCFFLHSPTHQPTANAHPHICIDSLTSFFDLWKPWSSFTKRDFISKFIAFSGFSSDSQMQAVAPFRRHLPFRKPSNKDSLSPLFDGGKRVTAAKW